MKNNTTRQRRGSISAICNFLFSPIGSQDIKELEKNIAILIQNQNLQQPFIESNAKGNNITCIHLTKNRHMINRLVDALILATYTTHENNIAINSLNYATNILLILAEIDNRLNLLQNDKRTLESDVSTISIYIDFPNNKVVTVTLINPVYL